MQLNPHYAELNESYLFSTIAHKVADYQKANPDADIIRLGIGDVTLPLAASVTGVIVLDGAAQELIALLAGNIAVEGALVALLLDGFVHGLGHGCRQR